MTDLTPFNDDYDSNNSGNAEFVDIFNKNITRRDLIKLTKITNDAKRFF